ncbi:hypothetical protein U1Q18_025750 [Sarracenia purpurea var. burkii]
MISIFKKGYDGNSNDWDDYLTYVNPDGVEMPPGVYRDNSSLMYHHGYGYAPYGPYSPAGSPVPTMGHNGQLFGAQHYQYPTPFFQTLTPTTNGSSYGIGNNGGIKGSSGSAPTKQSYPNLSFNSNGSFGSGGHPASGFHDPRFGFDDLRSSVPWSDGLIFSNTQPRHVINTSMVSSISHASSAPASRNQNFCPHSHLIGLHQARPMSSTGTAEGYMNRLHPNKLIDQYGSTFSSDLGFDYPTNGCGWFPVDGKYKPRGRSNGFFGFGNESIDGLNELNRGPRAKNSKNQKGFTPVALAVKGQNNILLHGTNDDKSNVIPHQEQEQYNTINFPENYSDAKFFIIKSYSEDDVHKSIKYSVWASTPSGNKKLDAAYQEAQQKSDGCPIFLLFSVNTSGQFVGVAEMVGPVDFQKNFEYWQQDKWNGCFPVKWHIVKDVSNGLLKHIILENNENKPVTNSRDTQEVKVGQGLQMLKIFKDHSSKTCILDDFGFYEGRQKTIQKKKKGFVLFMSIQVWEGKPIGEKNKDGANGELKSQKSSEGTSDLVKPAPPDPCSVKTNGNVELLENAKLEDGGVKGADKSTVVVLEKRIV